MFMEGGNNFKPVLTLLNNRKKLVLSGSLYNWNSRLEPTYQLTAPIKNLFLSKMKLFKATPVRNAFVFLPIPIFSFSLHPSLSVDLLGSKWIQHYLLDKSFLILDQHITSKFVRFKHFHWKPTNKESRERKKIKKHVYWNHKPIK